MRDRVSIVIRTKNEEDWIGICLKNIKNQKYENFEIIIVDNESSDGTLLHCKLHKVDQILSIKDFKPGAAINAGVRASSGDIVVILSAHCIPTDRFWLTNLVEPFNREDISAVYGRQLPLPYTSPDDTRDLLTVFGCESKVQTQDYTFHNANSAVRKSLLDDIPFSEEATNVEDWIWSYEIIQKGLKIYYSAEAKVWHYHGINQHGTNQSFRSEKVSEILSRVAGLSKSIPSALSANSMNGLIVFPYREGHIQDKERLVKVIAEIQNLVETSICLYSDAPHSVLEGMRHIDVIQASVDEDQPTIKLLEDALIQYEAIKGTTLDYIFFADFSSEAFMAKSAKEFPEILFEGLYEVVSYGCLDEHSFVTCDSGSLEGRITQIDKGRDRYNLMLKSGSVFRASVVRKGSIDNNQCKIITQ